MDVLSRLTRTQMLPLHITNFLSSEFKDPSVIRSEKWFLLLLRSAKWQLKFKTIDKENLRALDYLVPGLLDKMFNIQPETWHFVCLRPALSEQKVS